MIAFNIFSSHLCRCLAREMQVPPDADIPALDAYKHLQAWLDRYQELRGSLSDAWLVFPSVAVNGNINCSQAMSPTNFQRLFGSIFSYSGCPKQITSHSFRRSGAQWYFLHAKRRWSLLALKYWGGWAMSVAVRDASLLESSNFVYLKHSV